MNPNDYDKTAYIVGGGTSLIGFDWKLLDDTTKFVVAINSSHLVLPNCNLIYLTDPPYIEANLTSLTNHSAPVWQGVLNMNVPPKLPVVDKQIHLVAANGFIDDPDPYKVAHGSNSTFACLQLLVKLGWTTIYLLGIDMKWAKCGDTSTSHWHSDSHPHRNIDSEIVYRTMLANYTTIKQPLLDRGITVINVNTENGTMLNVFPIQSFEDTFGSANVNSS